jgi:uncharacterized membrane protein
VNWRPRLRRYFVIGLIVLAPIGATVVILRWLFVTLDAILGAPLRSVIGWNVPGLGLLLLLGTILLLGWVAQYAIGHEMINLWNRFLARFPLTARIYNAASQIVQTFMGDQRRVFLRTVLVRYPTSDAWALGLVTAESAPYAEAVLGEPCVQVFVASTPNPTTGWLLVVPKSRTRAVDVSIEDGMKLVLSAGAVLPHSGPVARPEGIDLAALMRRPER